MARRTEGLVLDSWSVLAYLEGEPAADQVVELLAEAHEARVPVRMSVVNVGEVWYILARAVSEDSAAQAISDLVELGIEFVPVEWKLAQRAARFKAKHAISFADCFAAALAAQQNARLVTGDREFRVVEGEVRIHWL